MRNNLGLRLLSLAVVAVVSVVAIATAASGASPPTVKVVQTAGFGKVLATSNGLTLYHYTDETRGKVDCKGGCRALWPPLLVKSGAKPIAGAGLTASKLGTIKRPDGGVQVTYNGLGLYRYAPDKKAGEVKGQGVLHAWYVISPAGKIVKRAASASTPPASSSSPTYTTPTDDGSGSGYGYG